MRFTAPSEVLVAPASGVASEADGAFGEGAFYPSFTHKAD